MLGNDLALIRPELILSLGTIALMMLGAFRREDTFRLATLLAIGLMVLAGFSILVGGDGAAFGGLLIMDGFGRFMKILALVGSALSLALSLSYLEREKAGRFEYPVLVLFATVGMMLMISANDLIALYLGLELQSLALYVVAAFRRDTVRSTEAGLKYFVLGALSSGMLLYGASLIYGFAGTTSFTGLAALLTAGTVPSTGIVVGIVFLAAGLAFKVSAVPFHMWTPDVYEGAPTPVTAFFAAAPKIAAIALFVRVMVGPFGGLIDSWRQIILFISIASMLFGALAAINQTNIKRLMAYSSIGNVGYALVGLAAGTKVGISGLMIYMAIYVVMTIGTFGVILAMRRDGKLVEGIADLTGFSRSHPLLALALALLMFSLSGIPPLAGFFGKLYVFRAAIQAKLYGLAVIGVLSSVIAAFYYLKIVKIMYFDEPTAALDRPAERDLSIIVGALALAILLFFLFPTSLITGAESAAATLFAG